jgi:hypothetical protein
MKRIVICLILILALLTACIPAALPQPTPDLAATNQVVNAITTSTQTASPTATLPSTGTPTLLAFPTDTPTATKTRVRPTKARSTHFVGCFTPTGVTNSTAPFKIENLTPKSVSVFINGVTRTGEHPIHCSYDLRGHTDIIFTIWWGDYTYLVQVAGKTSYTGSFWVNAVDKATMRVTKQGIRLGPFP